MATATLKRISLKAKPKVSEEIKQLARDAQVILRYVFFADDVLSGTEKLSTVLRRLEIKPFDWRQVEEYKEKRREAIRKKTGSYNYYWSETKLKDATAVPPFVLRKAIEIKRACPEVQLFVDALRDDPDPFLVAQLGREKFWIECWDEREFEL